MTLLEKANQILAEKTNNLLPNVLVTNYTVFGVTGTYTSDGNVASADIIDGKIAYSNGEKIIGTMNNQGNLIIEPNLLGGSYNAGYYSGITVNSVNASALEPNLSAANIAFGTNIFGIAGTFTSDANAVANMIPNGMKVYSQGQPIVGNMLYWRPNSDWITDPPDSIIEEQYSIQFHYLPGRYIYGNNFGVSVTKDGIVNAINLRPDQIVNGENILGVLGTAATVHNQNKVIAPSTDIQNILPDEGYTGLGKVTINAVTANIDPNIVPEKIANGVNILGVIGTAIGANLTTLEVLTNGTYNPPAGYDGFSSVNVMVPSMSSNIFIQTNQPATKQGIWINAEPQAYTLTEINEYNASVSYGSNQLLVVKGFDLNTKISGDMTYYFNTVLLSNASGDVQLSLRKYRGTGTSWEEIEDNYSVLTPEEAIEANSTLDNILGQPDQGDTDNLTPDDDIIANQLADDILGNN